MDGSKGSPFTCFIDFRQHSHRSLFAHRSPSFAHSSGKLYNEQLGKRLYRHRMMTDAVW